ncbi:MAG: ABC transporter substrate-binding protein [Treponema sp.]|jgi:peptide/nickel transport system substrate-binding protein|nr:ABC transporter substrate-binding protein [Treponema sp.]
MKKLVCLPVLSLFVAGAILVGCGQARDSDRTFTIALSEDIRALDPGLAWNYVTNQVTNQITEGLLTLNSSNEIVPELARSWSQSDDRTYIYEVRDDVVFSDGSKMTMDDVVFSFERYRNPDGGTYFSDFYADVESVGATGPWQLTIRLSQPSAVFKYIPAIGAGRIISKAYYERHADDFGSSQGGIVGTGPFQYESWTSGQEIVLKKNPNYWDKAKLAANIIDTLVYKVIPDDTTRVIALQTGDVDFSVNVPADMIDQFASSRNVVVTSVDTYSLVFLAFNTQRAPFDDLNVRRAISHALNLPEFNRSIVKSAGTLGTVLPFGAALYGENKAGWEQYLSRTEGYPYNPDRAKQLLAQSAYPNGFNANLIVGEGSLAGQRALFLQEALKPLNINVEIIRVDGDLQDTYQMGGILDSNGKRDYDMLLGGWEADYPDLHNNIEILYVSSQAGQDGYNAAAYINSQVDDLIIAQRVELDNARRFELQSRFMDIVASDAPYVIFGYGTRQSVLNRKYTGLAVTPAWLWVLPMQNIRAAR